MESNPSLSYRAVLIGIDEYPQRPLSGCVNDIDQIERILLDRLQVPAERITRFAAPRAGAASSTRLPSLSPTRDELRNFLHRLAEEVGPEDVVFFYYSGHGSQVMTRWNGHVIAREALVPLDFWNDGVSQRLLYDFELNGLFARIAESAGDLTVVLDCCHSASAVRGDRERYLEIPGIQDLPSDLSTEALTRDTSGLLPAAIPMLVGACTAIEKAFEVGGTDSQPNQGAFSYSLVRILDSIDRPLPDLRWWDIWTQLVDRISNLRVSQHPQIVGHGARRLFGGPWTRRDLGYVIRQDGERFRIEAGTLTGVSEGAELAIYRPEPDLFPPLGSSEDRDARIGVVRVDRADRSYCTAVSTNGSFQLPPGARARLVQPGQPDRLRVSLAPFDEALASRLKDYGVTALRPGSPGVEAELRREGDLFHLGDEIYDPGRFPLVSFSANEAGLPEAILRHYGRYRQTLRLPLRCQDLNGALRVELLDCGSRPVLSPEDLQAPSFPELPLGTPWRYKVREGEGFALRIDNRSKDNLSVFVLNCAGSGRVEYLGDAEIPAGSLHILWCDHVLGNPFYPTVGADRKEIIERIVVVGTTLPDRDLRHLEVGESFADVIRFNRIADKDFLTRAMAATPVEKWTAEMVTLRIYK